MTKLWWDWEPLVISFPTCLALHVQKINNNTRLRFPKFGCINLIHAYFLPFHFGLSSNWNLALLCTNVQNTAFGNMSNHRLPSKLPTKYMYVCIIYVCMYIIN